MEDTIKEFTNIKGLGEAKAKALADAGFKSVDELANASIEDLTSIEGVGEALANKIKAGALELSSETVEMSEESTEEPKATKTVEVGELAMDEESRRLFKLRKVLKGKKPHFNRTDSHKYKRLDSNWRRPRGLQGKQRKHIKAKGALAQVGYGSPVAVKGLHPSGYADVLVRNVGDIDAIDATIEAIRIARTVGAKKKAVIEEKAAELGIKVLNPTRGE
ncbi:MAG TPA: 50S ribosomal protein L32e [Methanosarcinaceae archaeon]|nr:50S ribosomal protein L32e [Methanosarcinaceae archaeon]